MQASTNAFLTWFTQWGQVVFFVAQMLFWAAIAVAALMVARQYKRFVTLKAARHAIEATQVMAEARAEADEPDPLAARINIGEFVE